MPRRSRNQITKELALKIVAKLGAEKVAAPNAAHDPYEVYHEGKLVAQFGIRHSSQKNKGHDYIPGELGVGTRFAKELGWCPKSRDDYLVAIGEMDNPGDRG
ncbi:MAG: hypothetical protein ABR915_12000 [Thermoguttaceae bacterium]